MHKKTDFESSDRQTDIPTCCRGHHVHSLSLLKLELGEQEDLDRNTMANNCCLRSLLSLLHCIIGLATGFFFVYSLLAWTRNGDCLPSLVDHFGDPIKFRNGMLHMCDGLVYSMGFLCVFNFVMCVFINCLWKKTAVLFVNLFLTLFFAAISVFGGAVFTVHHFLWCDSLMQWSPYHEGCKHSADTYDNFHHSSNMSSYYRQMEIQQVGIWCLFPLIFITVLTYAVAMRMSAFWQMERAEGQGSLRYVIFHDDTAPLLNVLTNQNSDSNDTTTVMQPNIFGGIPPTSTRPHEDVTAAACQTEELIMFD